MLNHESWSSSMLEVGRGEGFGFSHLFDNGFPHNPKFPSNELLSNVSNWLPCGIGPVSWLCETLKDARKWDVSVAKVFVQRACFEKGQGTPLLLGFLMIMGYDQWGYC